MFVLRPTTPRHKSAGVFFSSGLLTWKTWKGVANRTLGLRWPVWFTAENAKVVNQLQLAVQLQPAAYSTIDGGRFSAYNKLTFNQNPVLYLDPQEFSEEAV